MLLSEFCALNIPEGNLNHTSLQNDTCYIVRLLGSSSSFSCWNLSLSESWCEIIKMIIVWKQSFGTFTRFFNSRGSSYPHTHLAITPLYLHYTASLIQLIGSSTLVMWSFFFILASVFYKSSLITWCILFLSCTLPQLNTLYSDRNKPIDNPLSLNTEFKSNSLLIVKSFSSSHIFLYKRELEASSKSRNLVLVLFLPILCCVDLTRRSHRFSFVILQVTLN